jgi:hypothetical protein
MRVSRPNSGRPTADAIEFRNDEHGTYSGVSEGDRQWRILPIVTGWRLEFRDPGDQEATYAGSHRTLHAARSEAARAISTPAVGPQRRRLRTGSSEAGAVPSPRTTTDEPAPPAPPAGDRRRGGERRLAATSQTLRSWLGSPRGEDRRRGVDRRRHGVDRRGQGDDRRA